MTQFTKWLLPVAFICCFIITSCDDEEPLGTPLEEFEKLINAERQVQKISALSVLIFKEDQVLYETQLGLSQVEENVELESDHLFLLASISKVVTATALLQLYDDGLFELDDPINNYLDEFQVAIPNFTVPITFQMLLTHTSGIGDGDVLDGLYYYGYDSPTPLGDFLENYLDPDGELYDAGDNFYNFEPGTKHEYSNTGNALIGHLVETISGTNFNEYCKVNIFQPLGMEHTAWRLDEITDTIVQPYDYIDLEYQAIEHYTFTDYPNGGLRANAADLHTFIGTLVKGGSTDNFELLKPETVALMHTPQIPDIDAEVGLHMFIMDRDNELWGHDGGEQGVATIMAFNVATKVGAIILANNGEADLDEILSEAYLLGLEL